MDEDTLVYFGDAVKALGDGKVGGYLIRFSDATSPDLTGDYFSAKTDLGDAERLPVLYQHGMDVKVGKRRIGGGTLRRDDVGLWIEAQLNMRDEYEQAIYGLAEAQKVGWSSGAASHAVERKSVGNASEITQWFISEASLTPTPAEPRNVAISIKAIMPMEESQAEVISEEAEGIATETNPTQKESSEVKNIMEDKIETPEVKAPDFAALIAAEVKAQMDKIAVNDIGKAPAYNSKTKRGDDEIKAFAYFARTGDAGAIKASNAIDMNVGTSADGGYAVPTGHYQGIVARRDQSALFSKIGVRNIPGKGTTVNVPLDGEADGEFVTTSEASESDLDAPALGQAAMTLVLKTKRVLLSNELLNDEDSQLMAFLDDFVGRGLAKTENTLLMAEAANGTSLKTFAATGSIAAGEIDLIPFNNDIAPYAEDGQSTGWITRASTYGTIAALTGNTRLYADQTLMSRFGTADATLLAKPVWFSDKVTTPGASAKTIFYGNWNFMGRRAAPEITVLRDPYSRANYGQVVLHYYYRVVYKLLQAEAIGYGIQAAA